MLSTVILTDDEAEQLIALVAAAQGRQIPR
jgi:hypothetical protein